MDYGNKPLKEIFEELSRAGASYKFSAIGESVAISVDGLMHSLRPCVVAERAARKA